MAEVINFARAATTPRIQHRREHDALLHGHVQMLTTLLRENPARGLSVIEMTEALVRREARRRARASTR
jgi:hypothetical protein